MLVYERDGKVLIEGVKDFDLKQTLECGQCFRYQEIGPYEYVIVAMSRVIQVKQESDTLLFLNTTEQEVKDVWCRYFDLDRDYGAIKQWILSKDDKIKEAVEQKAGVRILNQEFFEMLITFIISQNKQIPHIMKIVETISEKYGTCLGEWEGKTYYAFPTVEQLSTVSIDDFLECKAGFRAKYLVDACKKVACGELREEELKQLCYDEALKRIQIIHGVGEKVGNCILLFGIGKREAFPIDVWMVRIMEKLYFNEVENVSKEKMQEFAKTHFGEYGGYAQQYLFYFSRDTNIKRKKEKK